MERADIEKKVEMIAGKSGKELRQTVIKMYPNIFKGLGKMEPEHHIKLKEDISPKVHPPRKIPSSFTPHLFLLGWLNLNLALLVDQLRLA